MKFSVKHALVVAIAALCVCVVAGSTVVAASMNNREAAASNPTATTFQLINEDESPATSQWIRVGGVNVVNMGNGMWSAEAGTLASVWFDAGGLRSLNGSRVMPFAMPYSFTAVVSGNFALGAQLQLTWTEQLLTSGFRLNTTTQSFTFRVPAPGVLPNLVFQRGEVENVRVMSTSARVTLSTVLPAPYGEQTRDINPGYYLVSNRVGPSSLLTTATGARAGYLPIRSHASTAINTVTNFRGWALVEGGPIIFPVGLPVGIFTDMRLFAIFS